VFFVGGKRPANGETLFDVNPCFCLPSIANCTVKGTGRTKLTENGISLFK
jgi:hypothetical protein